MAIGGPLRIGDPWGVPSRPLLCLHVPKASLQANARLFVSRGEDPEEATSVLGDNGRRAGPAIDCKEKYTWSMYFAMSPI